MTNGELETVFRLVESCDFSEYELIPLGRLGSKGSALPRRGTLLRFRFFNLGIGYSDCFPWVELGDAPYEEQIRLLKSRSLSSLTNRSLEFAYLDAQARSRNQGLFDHLEALPECHFLLTDWLNHGKLPYLDWASQLE